MAGKKILACAQDFGGANSIVPVMKKLVDNGYSVVGLNIGKLPIVCRERGININMRDLANVTPDEMNLQIEKICPDLVLTGTSVQSPDVRYVPDQELVLAARGKGVLSVSVLDLWQKYVERFSDVCRSEFLRFLPDKVAVMDEAAKNRMVELGFPEKKLEVTGNPGFESYKKEINDFTISKKSYEYARLRMDNPFAVFVSHPVRERVPGLGFDQYSALECFLRGYSGMPVVVKSSRDSAMDELEEIARKHGAVVDKDDKVKPSNVVLASDFVATPFSTDFYFALCAGKPVIAVQPNSTRKVRESLATYSFRDVLPVATTSDEVMPAARKAHSGEYVEKRSKIKPQEGCVDKIYDLVRDMLGE